MITDSFVFSFDNYYFNHITSFSVYLSHFPIAEHLFSILLGSIPGNGIIKWNNKNSFMALNMFALLPSQRVLTFYSGTL